MAADQHPGDLSKPCSGRRPVRRRLPRIPDRAVGGAGSMSPSSGRGFSPVVVAARGTGPRTIRIGMPCSWSSRTTCPAGCSVSCSICPVARPISVYAYEEGAGERDGRGEAFGDGAGDRGQVSLCKGESPPRSRGGPPRRTGYVVLVQGVRSTWWTVVSSSAATSAAVHSRVRYRFRNSAGSRCLRCFRLSWTEIPVVCSQRRGGCPRVVCVDLLRGALLGEGNTRKLVD